MPPAVVKTVDGQVLLESARQIRRHLELYGHELTAEQRQRFAALADSKQAQAETCGGESCQQ